MHGLQLLEILQSITRRKVKKIGRKKKKIQDRGKDGGILKGNSPTRIDKLEVNLFDKNKK